MVLRSILGISIALSATVVAHAEETMSSGLAMLYGARPARDAACDLVGRTIAAGTFEAMGMTAIGIDSRFRAVVNQAVDSEAVYSEIMNILPNTDGRVRAGSVPWMVLNSPNPAAKRAALQLQMQSAWSYLAEWKNGSSVGIAVPSLRFSRLVDVLEAKFGELGTARLSPASRPFPLFAQSPRLDYRAEMDHFTKRADATALCVHSFPKYTDTCSGAFVDTVLAFAPKQYAGDTGQFYWLLDPIMREVLEDPAYERPILQLAADLLRKVRTAEEQGTVDSDFVTEAYRLFAREVPKGSPLGMDRAWKLLAAYATQGASFGILETFIDRRVAPRLAALEVISSAVNYLDAYAELDGGKYFSLPRMFAGDCRITKPYHFWLSAYAAREAVEKRGRSIGSALVISHMLGYLYEFGAKSNGRADLAKVFRKGGLFSAHNDSLRLSILTKDLGALYGAEFGKYARVKNPVIDTGDQYRALRGAARESGCVGDSLEETAFFYRTPFFGNFAKLGHMRRIIGCFEKTLAIHASKGWKEFAY